MTVTSLILGIDVSPRRLGERFANKVEIDQSGCWIWTGAATKGYGQVKRNGIQHAAHRYAYQHLVGPIPAGLVLDHLCRETRCVNPAHLEPVTNAENIRRGRVGLNESTKTHCPQGHPYDETNTYSWKNGWRQCRACRLVRQREWRERTAA